MPAVAEGDVFERRLEALQGMAPPQPNAATRPSRQTRSMNEDSGRAKLTLASIAGILFTSDNKV